MSENWWIGRCQADTLSVRCFLNIMSQFRKVTMKSGYKKTLLKTALVLCLGLAGAMAVRADSGGDLIVGFTQSGNNVGGNDLFYDLGQASAITNNQTWNVSSLLTGQSFALNQVQWGVLGDYKNGGNATTLKSITWASSGSGTSPGSLNGVNAWNALQTPVNSIIQNTLGSVGAHAAGSSALIAATDNNSWYNQSINGGLPTQWINAYGGIIANVTGTNVANPLWVVVDNNTSPTNFGSITLSATGILKFTTVGVAAPTAAFSGAPLSGAAPLLVVFTNLSTGTITNWVWNLGDGTSVTNTSSANVNHTYVSAGSYTVGLTVTGPGGINTIAQTNYIVVSSAAPPAFSSLVLANGKLVLSGTGGTSGVQYRIFTTTNVAQPFANWTPVYTNNFLSNGSFAYTNTVGNASGFFRLVSP